jgi:uncharacterized membrane protein (UPF0127 family)
VLNSTKGNVVAEDVSVAHSFWSRFCGLMLRKGLADNQALLIEPSGSIHTAFMRFPIDAVFLDREKTVVKVAENVRPYRISFSSGHSVLEMVAGCARKAGVERGDRLVVDDQDMETIKHNRAAVAVIDKREQRN